jgi:diaminohydroxyphosphoribosylaminopyrimidine deaminase / 5-amino-6-(5-phosphoribosylamino)uracil reductase
LTKSANEDGALVARAIELARRGVALAHPNPMVGAVLVKHGKVIAEGFHTYDGRRHAEIIALEKAGEQARGSTLYVNLEPCCHLGRTGPCTDALIAAGVRRVVAAMKDPNPAVAGRGFHQLSKASVAVETGNHAEEAKRLNEAFAKWIRTGRPLVVMKSALTLDGQIAPTGKKFSWITSEASREEVQRLRHASDAVITGIGTALSDDPLLTDRTGLARRRPLLRVVIDSHLQLPLRSRLVKSAAYDLLVFTTQRLEHKKAQELKRAGAEVIRIRANRGHVDLKRVVEELGRRQIVGALLEAGSRLNGAALEAGIVDKVILFYSPRILGTATVPVVKFRPHWAGSAPEIRDIALYRFGLDFAVEGYLRDVYGDHRANRKN